MLIGRNAAGGAVHVRLSSDGELVPLPYQYREPVDMAGESTATITVPAGEVAVIQNGAFGSQDLLLFYRVGDAGGAAASPSAAQEVLVLTGRSEPIVAPKGSDLTVYLALYNQALELTAGVAGDRVYCMITGG